MHILIGVAGVLLAAIAWYWRIQTAARVGRELRDDARGVLNTPRRLSFRHRAGKSGLDVLTTPVELGMATLFEMARAGGAISRDQKEVIRAVAIEHFALVPEAVDSLMVQAGWVVDQGPAWPQAVAHLAMRLRRHPDTTPGMLAELSSMLQAVAEVEGAPTSDQTELLARFRRDARLIER